MYWIAFCARTLLPNGSSGGAKPTIAILPGTIKGRQEIVGLVAAYILSLYFSIQTTIYLLLRKSVDGAEMTEVYREEDEETFAAAPEAEKKDETGPEKKES